MSLTPIKTAVIGYGFSAKTFHIPFITALPDFELVAISSSQRAAVNADWPSVHCYDDALSLLNQSDVQLVIITAPNDVHFELAKLALMADKHVVIEKPFVIDATDGDTLINLAKDKGKVLSVYHNRRWDGDFLTVKQLIESRRLGDIKHYESHFDRFRPSVRQRWREQAAVGGGVLFDLGPHLLDQALILFGTPNGITAQCCVMREGSNNVDYFHIVLDYAEHNVVLHCDLFSAGPNRRFTVKGNKGHYEKLGLDPQEPRLIEGVLPTTPEWAAESPKDYGTVYNESGAVIEPTITGGYQHYFSELAVSIRNGTLPPVTAEQALENIKLITLAMKSSKLGKRIAVV